MSDFKNYSDFVRELINNTCPTGVDDNNPKIRTFEFDLHCARMVVKVEYKDVGVFVILSYNVSRYWEK